MKVLTCNTCADGAFTPGDLRCDAKLAKEVGCHVAYLLGDRSPLLPAAPCPPKLPPGQTGTTTPCRTVAFFADTVHHRSSIYKCHFAFMAASAATMGYLDRNPVILAAMAQKLLCMLTNSCHIWSVYAEHPYSAHKAYL